LCFGQKTPKPFRIVTGVVLKMLGVPLLEL